MTTIKPKTGPIAVTSQQPVARPASAAPTATTAAAAWTGAAATRPSAQPSAAAATAPAGLPVDPRQMDIVCPVLGALVGSGKLKMDADGTVKFTDLSKSLKEIGVTPDLRLAAAAVATVANPSTLHNLTHQEFNALELRSGRFKHQADSGILTNGRFDETRFQELTAHAENGVMTADSFAKAVLGAYERDAPAGEEATKAGVGISKIEYSLALSAFGTVHADGKFGVSVADLRMLYQDKKIPMRSIGSASVPELMNRAGDLGKRVDAQFAARALNGPSTSRGLSQAGVRLAGGVSDSAATAATLSAGKAANCPHLNGAPKPTQAPAAIVKAHQQ
jgi:hypothetical protein